MTDDFIPLAVVQQIDTACDKFESEWKSGKHPRIEDYLDHAEALSAREFRRSLLQVKIGTFAAGRTTHFRRFFRRSLF